MDQLECGKLTLGLLWGSLDSVLDPRSYLPSRAIAKGLCSIASHRHILNKSEMRSALNEGESYIHNQVSGKWLRKSCILTLRFVVSSRLIFA
jgi:hypothetical protein